MFSPKPSRHGAAHRRRIPGRWGDSQEKIPYGRLMLRHGIVMLCLLITSLITTATVHASEVETAPALECSGFVHSEGDADHTTGDADKVIPHHHGNCNGAAFILADSQEIEAIAPTFLHPVAFALIACVRWTAGPNLRPPIA